MHQAETPQRLVVSKDRRLLTLHYEGGRKCALTAEFLRVESPSAEVQGHNPSEKITVAGKQHVEITDMTPIGRYAVRIVFSDGHDSGYYSWAWLEKLAREHDSLWRAYLSELEKKGFSRKPAA